MKPDTTLVNHAPIEIEYRDENGILQFDIGYLVSSEGNLLCVSSTQFCKDITVASVKAFQWSNIHSIRKLFRITK
jgi:hypothetical protein